MRWDGASPSAEPPLTSSRLAPGLALAVAATLCASGAAAQVYRWTDDKGKVHYGDRPPEEAKAKPVDTSRTDLSTTGGTAGDVSVLPTDVQWFPVRGLTRAHIRETMQQTAPFSESKGIKVWGQCAWRIRWKFTHRREPTGCSVDGVALTVSAWMKLPRWEDEARATPELRAQWEDFSRRLRKHEDGHRDNGVAAARDLARRLRGLPPFADCEALNREIDRVGERVVSEYRKVDEAFDRVEYLYATGF